MAGERAGVRTVTGFVHHVSSAADRVTGVVLADGTTIAAPTVVLANGAWAGQVTGIPPVPVRPVKGQILRLDPGRFPQPGVVVRAFTRGTEIYLVPRDGGRELVVGATTEELGFDRRVTAGGVYELLRDARLAIPMSAEYVLAETSVGYRPGTPDNAPILGRGAASGGLVLATGHYRNGVLLTPITADVVAELVLHDRVPDVAAAFGPERFETASPELAGPRARSAYVMLIYVNGEQREVAAGTAAERGGRQRGRHPAARHRGRRRRVGGAARPAGRDRADRGCQGGDRDGGAGWLRAEWCETAASRRSGDRRRRRSAGDRRTLVRHPGW